MDHFRNVFLSIPGLACLVAEDMTVVDANIEFLDTQFEGESIGVKFCQFLPKETDKAYFRHSLNQLRTDRINFDQMDFQTNSGSIVVKWNGSKVIDSDLLLLVGLRVEEKDIDVPVSAPHQDSVRAVDVKYNPIPYCKQDLVHIMNRVPIGFHSVADDGLIIWANNTLLSILGYESNEYIGQNVVKFVDDLPTLILYGNHVRAGKHIPNFPYRMIAKDGTVKKFTASIDANFYPDGRFHYSRTFFRYDMDDIVNQAIANERVVKQTAIAAEKDRFLRVMFHEIRTPMHNLSSCFQNVVKQHKLSTSAVNEMSYQIDACTGLVEDLSFSTMFESDQVLHPRPVKMNLRKELEYLLEHVTLYHDLELNSRPLTIEKDIDFAIPEIIVVDPSLLKALNHLIKNAVKYCCSRGTVSICMTYSEADPTATTPTSATSPRLSLLKSGTLSVSIKNSVSEAMDLVMVNRMFQSPYTSHAATSASFTPITKEALLTSFLTSMQGSNPGSPSAARIPAAAGLTVSLDCVSLDKDSRRTDSPHSSISDSLMSSEGLGLGLYVAYNIISNLGGLLECCGSESESVFSFKLAVQAKPSEPHRLRTGSGSVFNSSRGGASVGKSSPGGTASGVGTPIAGGSLLNQLLNKKWFSAIDSEEGMKHVDCSGIKQAGAGDTASGVAVEHVRGHKPRILVVDDSPICRKVLVKALESNGYDTDTAFDGKEACEKLDRPPCLFDAVLMDLRMPIMDGITATRVCKSKSHLSELPIIIVTAELGEEVRRECMEAKASHFISKPAKMDELLELVRMYVK